MCNLQNEIKRSNITILKLSLVFHQQFVVYKIRVPTINVHSHILILLLTNLLRPINLPLLFLNKHAVIKYS